MRRLPALLAVVLAAVAAVSAFAWYRVGVDSHRGVAEQARAHAEILSGAALDAARRLESAEQALADRLTAVARLAADRLDRERRPQHDVLEEVARAEGAGRMWLVTADGRVATSVRWPPPVPGHEGPAAALVAQAEERSAVETARSLAPPEGKARVEGLKASAFGAVERFSVAYGLASGQTLVLRLPAEEWAELRRLYGLAPALARVASVDGVLRASLVSAEGRSVLDGLTGEDPVTVPIPPRIERGVALTDLSDAVRATTWLSLAGREPLAVDVVVSTEREDRAVARSRAAILVGAALAALLAVGAAILVTVVDRRHQRAKEALEARREEDRRLAETGALASLFVHEISNPLSSIRLGIRLLEGSGGAGGGEGTAAVVATLKAEVDRVAATLESFLALARGRRTGLETTGPDALDRAKRRVAALAADRDVSLDVVADPRAPEGKGNPSVVEQALASVLRNAVQASPRKGVVRARWESESDGIHVVVTDQGPGFPADREGLVALGGTTKPGGHGLGLALAKRFLEAEGGRLVLSDAKGGGARVEVVLAPSPPRPEASP